LLRPRRPNCVWHIDLISLRFLWFRFTAAALLDGFSRRLLQLHLYGRTPCQRDMAVLVRRAAREYGTPQFLISDHGTQFRKRFHAAMALLNIRHVKGRVRAPYLNGKLERAFRTYREWWRLLLPGLSRRHLQRRLDDYRVWYNQHRPHSALNGRTPDEAWMQRCLPQPVALRQRDPARPVIAIHRQHCGGDPHLPVLHITLRRAA
jgi:transposase InsO family protein